MKNLSLILSGLLVSGTLAYADFLSVSAGVGYEQQNISGYVKKDNSKNYFGKHTADPSNNIGYLGLEDKNNPYVWVKFIHPIPLIPNIKIQYTKYHSTGYSDYIDGNVKIFGDLNIPYAITDASTKFDINSYDITLFYEFKPVVADIEAGFGVDYWDSKLTIDGEDAAVVNGKVESNGNKRYINASGSVILPYLYANVETMQFFGFSLIANVKWAKITDAHHYDYIGALKYTIDILGPVNPFIKVGYRYKELYGKDKGNETTLSYKGAFLEIGAKF